MSDLISILETIVADVESGRAVALCVVLQKQGSVPQVPGAAMLVRSDSSSIGTVGGGVVETEVRHDALELMEEGRSALLELSLDHDDIMGGVGTCGGRMSIGIMSITSAANLKPFAEALELIRRHKPARVPIVVEHAGKLLEYRLHVDVPPTLVIAGAGHVGQALANLAAGLNFHVVVIDDRAEVASRERFDERVELVVDDIVDALRQYPIDAGCYIVVATREHRQDREALEAVVQRPAGYVGMLGSRKKSKAILNALAEAGVPREMIERVHTPIGFSIGAVTVNEIAVSIAAELIQVRREHAPRLIEGPFEASSTDVR